MGDWALTTSMSRTEGGEDGVESTWTGSQAEVVAELFAVNIAIRLFGLDGMRSAMRDGSLTFPAALRRQHTEEKTS